MLFCDGFGARLGCLLFNLFTVGCLSKQAALSSYIVLLQCILLAINQTTMSYFPHSQCSYFRLAPFPAGYYKHVSICIQIASSCTAVYRHAER